ncbi:glycosyltransferase family 2 protein [Reichenbachiella versicolor]|uniref:glycosyltransferase family 2 protein n=1 Tax=Reichenbachiella versicolor TaxID=1821036 RepID=UPI000D6E42ED|nr:glycosyltransferase family 2 protein [Reichenbachiella versicolor]
MSSDFKLSIIVPFFNEESIIQDFVDSLVSLLLIHKYDYELLLIDDGSNDHTLEKIYKICLENERIKYLSFSRNFGHQAALKAGLDHSIGDCVLSMDGDLEHPIELIPAMISKWQDGFEVVNTLRKEHSSLGLFKRLSSKLFYSLMNFLSDIELKEGSADFRLLDRKVVNVTKSLPETPLFIRGMVSWLGFKQTEISYEQGLRTAGDSKFTKRKMVNFSISGISSFSIKPLRLSLVIGLVIASLSMLYGCYAVYIKIFTDTSVDGWASLLATVSFLGGIQMLMFGLLGEYLGRLFISSKNRPSYVIRETNLN